MSDPIGPDRRRQRPQPTYQGPWHWVVFAAIILLLLAVWRLWAR